LNNHLFIKNICQEKNKHLFIYFLAVDVNSYNKSVYFKNYFSFGLWFIKNIPKKEFKFLLLKPYQPNKYP